MRFSKLVLQNWRNFLRVEVDLRERMFVVGPNASGKSNLLDAFRFLRDIAEPRGGSNRRYRAVAAFLGFVRCTPADTLTS